MRKYIRRTLMLMAAVVLLAGAIPNVARAHSGHHSLRRKIAIRHVSCYQQDGYCGETPCYQDDSYCSETPCYQDDNYCSDSPCYQQGGGSRCSGHHGGRQSGHHSERGHGSHH